MIERIAAELMVPLSLVQKAFELASGNEIKMKEWIVKNYYRAPRTRTT